jgi:hypothetical protein
VAALFIAQVSGYQKLKYFRRLHLPPWNFLIPYAQDVDRNLNYYCIKSQAVVSIEFFVLILITRQRLCCEELYVGRVGDVPMAFRLWSSFYSDASSNVSDLLECMILDDQTNHFLRAGRCGMLEACTVAVPQIHFPDSFYASAQWFTCWIDQVKMGRRRFPKCVGAIRVACNFHFTVLLKGVP